MRAVDVGHFVRLVCFHWFVQVSSVMVCAAPSPPNSLGYLKEWLQMVVACEAITEEYYMSYAFAKSAGTLVHM